MILFVPSLSPKGRRILGTKPALPYGKNMPLGYPCYNFCFSHSSHTDTRMYKAAFGKKHRLLISLAFWVEASLSIGRCCLLCWLESQQSQQLVLGQLNKGFRFCTKLVNNFNTLLEILNKIKVIAALGWVKIGQLCDRPLSILTGTPYRPAVRLLGRWVYWGHRWDRG